MPSTYIASLANNPAQADDIFNDSELSVDLTVEYRKAVEPNCEVFYAESSQDCQALLQGLFAVKAGQALNSHLLLAPSIAKLKRAGLIGADNKGIANFTRSIQGLPKIEIILSVGNGQHAVFSMSNAGAAYADPKGTACPNAPLDPNDPNDPNNPNKTLPNILKNAWLSFYNKPGDAQAKQQLVQDNTHFHTTKQQPDDDKHSGFDWCLTNLGILGANVNVDATALRDAHKLNRADMEKDINAARERNPEKPPRLVYHNESKNERQKQERRRQLEKASKRHQYLYKESDTLWRQAEEGGPVALHNFRRNPQYAYVEVYRSSEPPEYKEGEGENVNRFSTQRNDDYGQPTMKNEFELKEDNGTTIKSTGGSFTYEKRFLRMAEDLFASWADDDDHAVHDVIVLRNIQPLGPERERECLEAFKKIFGLDRVRIKEAPEDRSPIAPDAIHGGHPRH